VTALPHTAGSWTLSLPSGESVLTAGPQRPRIAVYGIGNTLMGDDGVGPAVIHYLAAHGLLPETVTAEDLGTPSLDLPSYLAGFDLVIFVDAVVADGPPGTICTFSREEIVATPTGIRISPHEPTINDALIVLDFAGTAPEDVVLVGIVPHTLEGGMNLSPDVARAVPAAAQKVLDELAKRVASRVYA
jgi:hydrogenase maturation protease